MIHSKSKDWIRKILVLSIFLSSSLFCVHENGYAELIECNGIWQNSPCDSVTPGVSIPEVQKNLSYAAKDRSEKRSLAHEALMKSVEAKKIGIFMDATSVEAACGEDRAIESCRIVSENFQKTASNLIEKRRYLIAREREIQIQEEAAQKNPASSSEVVVIEKTVHEPYLLIPVTRDPRIPYSDYPKKHHVHITPTPLAPLLLPPKKAASIAK